jgi:hypothetical protein
MKLKGKRFNILDDLAKFTSGILSYYERRLSETLTTLAHLMGLVH